MVFKPMDPAVIRALISNVEDVITPALRNDAALLDSVPCPVCGSQGADKAPKVPTIVDEGDGQFAVLNSPFSASSPIIQGYAKCRSCSTVFEPMTRVIVQQPEPVITSVSPEDLRRGPRNR